MFRLHPTNVLGIRAFAEQFVCPSLVEASNKYIQKHFVEVSRSEEFLMLPVSDVLDIISRDELYVTSEEQVRHTDRHGQTDRRIISRDELYVTSEEQVLDKQTDMHRQTDTTYPEMNSM